MELCVISESPRWPGCALFQVEHPDEFYDVYHEWVSRFLVLNELFLLRPFVAQLESDGFRVHIAESAYPLFDEYDRGSIPLKVNGFGLNLFDYQSFGLNRALARVGNTARADRTFFWNWATGTGKSAISAGGSQELFNRNAIDLTLSFTLKTLRRSVHDFYTGTTQLEPILVEGTTARRNKLYQEYAPVYILNYDKAHWDLDALLGLVRGKRVLFVMDEVQKILTDDSRIKARKGMDSLIKVCSPIVWPMSASVVSQTPLRYRDVYALDQSSKNPLGTRKEFEDAYLASKRVVQIPTKYGRSFPVTYYNWDTTKLSDVRHRVAERTQSVRKTDPSVRENFKGMQVQDITIELSHQDRRLYDIIQERAQEATDRGESVEPYLRLLRYVCNTPEALAHSTSEIAQEIVQEYPDLITSKHSEKMETLLDRLEAIRDQGDKAVVFTQWTHLSLFMIADQLDKRKIKHSKHYGTGMTNAQRDQAVSDFKTVRDTTVFLSSDAGAHGLSFQMARYVLNYDIPFSYDLLVQRNNRIDRADSYLDGLTSYVYVTKGTVEERIWRINNERRALASATLGTKEVLSYGGETDPEYQQYLVFGT